MSSKKNFWPEEIEIFLKHDSDVYSWDIRKEMLEEERYEDEPKSQMSPSQKEQGGEARRQG
jgi:hypothetical protein